MGRLQRRGTDTVGPATHLEDELGLTEQRDHALHRRAALLLALDLVDLARVRARVRVRVWVSGQGQGQG